MPCSIEQVFGICQYPNFYDDPGVDRNMLLNGGELEGEEMYV